MHMSTHSHRLPNPCPGHAHVHALPQTAMKHVDNFYTVTSLSWRPDGSKLTVGGLTGTVDVYDACVRVSDAYPQHACHQLLPFITW